MSLSLEMHAKEWSIKMTQWLRFALKHFIQKWGLFKTSGAKTITQKQTNKNTIWNLEPMYGETEPCNISLTLDQTNFIRKDFYI